MKVPEKRLESRLSQGVRTTPVSCYLLTADGERVALKIVNYHHRGACFQAECGDYRVQTKESYLQFKIGHKEVAEKIRYRIVWENLEESGQFGVEFEAESAFVLARAERFMAHAINAPVVSANDPLDPNRKIYFKALNISATGMLLSTSLSNKHLFPGMELRKATLECSGIGKCQVDLFIENSRPSPTDNTVHYGVSLKDITREYKDLAATYVSNLGMVDNPEERIEKLSSSGLMKRELRSHLTIRQVTEEKDYEEVLKLRYMGYNKAGKTRQNSDFRQMGEGLKQEGLVLGAYLGRQLVASVELRFSREMPLRLQDKLSFESFNDLKERDFLEINKLVVHPQAQRTDIVVGLFQKIHSLAMINGKPHGLLVAEDKLVALYLRLGAKKIGLSIEHPVRPDVRLNIMVIPRETYEDASGINPLAWSFVYETTHEFFNEIGISRKHHLSLISKIKKWLSQIAVKIPRKKKKEGAKRTAGAAPAAMASHTVIDPKWTKQHIHASVLLPYLLVSDDLIGAEKTNFILGHFGFVRGYFTSASNWISVAFYDEFIEQFKNYGPVEELQKKAGYRNLSKEVLGVNHFLLKHFLTVNEAFRAFGSHLAKFNKTRTSQVVESGYNFCRIRLGLLDKNLKPRDPSTQLNWSAIFDAHVLTMTGRHGEVEQVKSIFQGDEYCEYLIRWKTSPVNLRLIASLVIVVTAMFGIYQFSRSYLSTLESIGFVSIFVLTSTVAALFKGRRDVLRRYYAVTESLNSFQRDADERYRELQNSKAVLEKGYQEGKVLEKISREIQKNDDLMSILQSAMSAICEQFDFARAFIMLADSDRRTLRTVAVRGAGETAPMLWNFKVDVSIQRETPVVLSSVFHSGQSILIANIEDHLFHLNEDSQKLIQSLQTQSFAMVALPSEGGSWGVVVADKGPNADIITRRDLVALQRISQAIGLALDKKAKIDSEVRIRRIFQKYVPSSVVEDTLGESEPQLGGEDREVICLFIDIRNFTFLSQHVPSQLLVEMLNQIFDLLQKSIRTTGGVIDKFLGDGALVTWGASPGSPLDSEKALQSAFDFLVALEIWNCSARPEGIPLIEVGIGVHRGVAIAGNIGSQDRMEYTVIGPTVNLASRLEQLTKMFGCELIISSSVVDFSSLSPEWRVGEDVQVRGVDGTVKVAMFTQKKSKVSGGESAAS